VSLQDANSWFSIGGGAAGVLGFLYVAWDSWRKGRKKRIDEGAVITTNAVQLMEQLRKRANELERQLDGSTTRAEDLSGKLIAANERADALKRQHDDMASKLADAQAEVRILRGQVKMLSAELDRRGTCPEDTI